MPDNFTHSLYKLVPYRGCAHGCRYCDGRAEKYYVEGDFERDIEARGTIPELLTSELPRLRENGMIALGSGTTDPYQPCEALEDITHEASRILAAWNQGEPNPQAATGVTAWPHERPLRFPAAVMTKSVLAIRDLPAWRKVNEGAGFILLVSITSLDEELRRRMEPGASPFRERLEMMRIYKEAGCTVGALAMPLLPGLSDDESSIRELYSALQASGVDFIMPGGLTLRPGRQKDRYLQELAEARPDLLATTRDLYREDRASGSPTWVARTALFSRIAAVRRDFAIPYLLPHAIYRRMLPPHDSLRILLRDMAELYAERKIDIAPLLASADRYDAWLLALRREYRRKRSLPSTWLEERVSQSIRSGEFEQIFDNRRLARFCLAVLRDGAVFDYTTLKLRVDEEQEKSDSLADPVFCSLFHVKQ